MSTVVDASALVQLLLRTPASRVVAEAIATGDARAPALIGVEALSAIAGLERRGVLDRDAAARAASAARIAPISHVPDAQLLERAWSLRHNVTPYDALYVALAEALGCPLLTADARLARGVEGVIAVTLLP